MIIEILHENVSEGSVNIIYIHITYFMKSLFILLFSCESVIGHFLVEYLVSL